MTALCMLSADLFGAFLAELLLAAQLQPQCLTAATVGGVLAQPAEQLLTVQRCAVEIAGAGQLLLHADFTLQAVAFLLHRSQARTLLRQTAPNGLQALLAMQQQRLIRLAFTRQDSPSAPPACRRWRRCYGLAAARRSGRLFVPAGDRLRRFRRRGIRRDRASVADLPTDSVFR